ncbi:hypothetical protein AM588_10010468 [Phytophthora nicotianae]|uniref:Uncharacterized protein n=1 Tax=Phytophthora nicotianae TaxID=4792 RepID=A0A0W8DC41_PHYNI|nr:hypothetical protein AM588_10010468 [Phytophthora nicotianae]
MGNTVTLHSACEYGDLAEVHRLLKTATAEELEATDDSGRTPLLLAVASLKHLREHQELIDDFDDLHGFVESDEETETNTQTHEQIVAESSNSETEETVNEVRDDTDLELMPKEAEILHLLLQRRVNVDHKDENGWTALHHACFVQNAVAIKMLIHAGAKPMRESYGLLPQDLLQRGHMSEWVAQAQELKEALDQITDKSAYAIKLLAFRPSGIVQLDMGGQVEKGSFVTCFSGEIFQYELFLYERVVEVESIPEFEFIDQPLIVLKRIGIVVGEDIDWVTIRPDNHIVAVNDIRIDAMEFAEAVRVLQENNGRQCTKLLMQNYSACGDFIPEKILGVGVIGKYAYLHPVDDDQDVEGDEQTYEEWVRNSLSENGDGNGESEVSLGPVSTQLSAIQMSTEATETSPPPSILSLTPPAEERGVISKVVADENDDRRQRTGKKRYPLPRP